MKRFDATCTLVEPRVPRTIQDAMAAVTLRSVVLDMLIGTHEQAIAALTAVDATPSIAHADVLMCMVTSTADPSLPPIDVDARVDVWIKHVARRMVLIGQMTRRLKPAYCVNSVDAFRARCPAFVRAIRAVCNAYPPFDAIIRPVALFMAVLYSSRSLVMTLLHIRPAVAFDAYMLGSLLTDTCTDDATWTEDDMQSKNVVGWANFIGMCRVNFADHDDDEFGFAQGHHCRALVADVVRHVCDMVANPGVLFAILVHILQPAASVRFRDMVIEALWPAFVRETIRAFMHDGLVEDDTTDLCTMVKLIARTHTIGGPAETLDRVMPVVAERVAGMANDNAVLRSLLTVSRAIADAYPDVFITKSDSLAPLVMALEPTLFATVFAEGAHALLLSEYDLDRTVRAIVKCPAAAQMDARTAANLATMWPQFPPSSITTVCATAASALIYMPPATATFFMDALLRIDLCETIAHVVIWGLVRPPTSVAECTPAECASRTIDILKRVTVLRPDQRRRTRTLLLEYAEQMAMPIVDPNSPILHAIACMLDLLPTPSIHDAYPPPPPTPEDDAPPPSPDADKPPPPMPVVVALCRVLREHVPWRPVAESVAYQLRRASKLPLVTRHLPREIGECVRVLTRHTTLPYDLQALVVSYMTPAGDDGHPLLTRIVRQRVEQATPKTKRWGATGVNESGAKKKRQRTT
jgi:hypothetical protein